jgi:small-conductance mechanosensitive channel
LNGKILIPGPHFFKFSLNAFVYATSPSADSTRLLLWAGGARILRGSLKFMIRESIQIHPGGAKGLMRPARREAGEKWRLLWVCCAAALGLCANVAGATDTTNAASSDVVTNVAPIPPANIAALAESAASFLQSIESDLSSDHLAGMVQTNLAVQTPEIDTRLDENSKMLLTSQSIRDLRRLASSWQNFHDELAGWQQDLTKRVDQLQKEMERLEHVAARWQATSNSAEKAQIPPELLKRVTTVIGNVKQELQKVEDQRAVVLTLLSQISDLDGRVSQMLAAVERARVERLSRLFVQDSPGIWNVSSLSGQSVAQAGQHSFSRQVKALRAYAERKKERFVLHGLLFLVLLGVLLGARRNVRRRAEHETGLQHPGFFFEVPVPTALLLSLLASSWIYPQAPRLLDAIIGAAALIPATLILRKLVDHRLFPVLDWLVGLYFVDQLRIVAAAQAVLSRWLFLAEMLGAAGFSLWLARRAGAYAKTEAAGRRLWKNISLGTRFALALFAVTIIADAVGYVGLGKFIGHASLSCAYLALILYAAVQILDGLIHIFLSVRPLAELGMVNRHGSYLQFSVRRLLIWIAAAVWVLYALETISLREPFFEDLRSLLTARRGIGAMRFEFLDVLLFMLTIWAAFWTSRAVRFVLKEEIYPRIQLAPGLYYSVSTILHYVILLVGSLIALFILGFNLQNLTILAGAFSVGLGFGLQNIVNNFVSGIILLFERPIKVGDVVQMEAVEGVVQRIGIRASIVRTASGAEIIVPNGKLISDPVTNWTLSDRHRRIEIPLAVAAGVEPKAVTELLIKTAAAHPLVLRDPPPQVLLVNPGGGALNLELRAWTDHAEDCPRIRSDLALAVRLSLAAEKISLQ